jgi:hypothetical protein
MIRSGDGMLSPPETSSRLQAPLAPGVFEGSTPFKKGPIAPGGVGPGGTSVNAIRPEKSRKTKRYRHWNIAVIFGKLPRRIQKNRKLRAQKYGSKYSRK